MSHKNQMSDLKCCEMGPKVIFPYLKRLESLAILTDAITILRRQLFFLSYFKTLSVGLAVVWTCNLLFNRLALSQLS